VRRSLLWALFILCVMATASMTAGAETRLLGPPIADATPPATPTCSYVQAGRPSWENNPNWWTDGNDAVEALASTPGDPQTTSPAC
jgi:hypothetical protein